MNLDYVNEIQTVHEVKVALCYLLEKIGGKIPEKDLYEIVFDTEFINYFLYAEALDELIANDSTARETLSGVSYIELHDKGREAADILKKDVQYRFRKHLLEAAYRYKFESSVKSTVTVKTEDIPNGCNVIAIIGDSKLELMKISLYAPDKEQADFLSSQICENPTEFYRTVIDSLLKNKRPPINFEEKEI
jgi:hypothetical protein